MFQPPTTSPAFAHAPTLLSRPAALRASSFHNRPCRITSPRLPSLPRRRPIAPLATASADSARGGATPQPNLPNGNAGASKKRLDKKKKISLFGLFFLFITYAWSVVLFIPMLVMHPFVLCFDRGLRRFHDFIATTWLKVSLATVFMTPKIHGISNMLPPGQVGVYVANHTSYLDIYSFGYLNRRMRFLSKAEVFDIPIVGWAMRMTGNIPVRRMNRRGQIEAFRKMVACVRVGLSLVVFPEGTRSETGKLRRFQSGAFRCAKQENLPVVPVTILGTRDSMPSYAWVPLRFPPTPISLVIHPPIETADKSVSEVQDLAFKAIDSALPPEIQTRPPLKHK